MRKERTALVCYFGRLQEPNCSYQVGSWRRCIRVHNIVTQKSLCAEEDGGEAKKSHPSGTQDSESRFEVTVLDIVSLWVQAPPGSLTLQLL